MLVLCYEGTIWSFLEIWIMLVLCYEGTICLVCWKSPQTFVLVSNWLHSTEQNHFYVDAFKQGFSYFQSLLIQSYTSRRFSTNSK